jgi:hypothetical protein
MRITIAHNKSKEQVIQAVDCAIEDAFRGLAVGPVTISDQKKTWTGSTMTFSMTARMGFLTNPIRGTVEVRDQDVTIDADLGIFSRLIPESKIRTSMESRVRGLLT